MAEHDGLDPVMQRRCVWCRQLTDTDRCAHCDRLRDVTGFTYVVYGGGVARDTGSRAEAEQLLEQAGQTNSTVRLYVAYDAVGASLESRARLVLRPHEATTFTRLLRQVMETPRPVPEALPEPVGAA